MERLDVKMGLAIGLIVLIGAASACGKASTNEGRDSLNSTPLKENGERSYEFEPDDIERAERAPPAVRAYCEDAVSEAQEIGCLSHVDESDLP
jgi:hypothetical protein